MKSLRSYFFKTICIVFVNMISFRTFASLWNIPDFMKDFLTIFPRVTNLTPKFRENTLLGVSHSSTEDVILHNYDNLTCYLETSSAPGGYLSCQNFTLTNCTGEVFFSENSSTAQGGALYASQKLTITKNSSETIFNSNTACNVYVTSNQNRGGALYAGTNLEVSNNKNCLYFTNNSTLGNGGAIFSASDSSIQNNQCSILFLNNSSFSGDGGAISCSNLNISGNSSPIYFVKNKSHKGGALVCSANISIENNSENVIFHQNMAIGSSGNRGGAIFCNNFTVQNNPGTLVFNNNFASRDGGSLCTANFTIRNSGPIYFTNNHANWGGAFMLRQNSICSLFAELGDIIFNNNTSYATLWTGKRNAIHCTAGVSLSLGASAGRTLAFYDPIEHGHTTSTPLVFNPESYHQGTVLFSGATVPKDLIGKENFYTESNNTSELRNGVLAIERSAWLGVFKLSQTGGTLRLGGGGTLSNNTNAATGSTITITNLALNLPSILSTGVAPKIWIYPSSSTQNSVTTYTENANTSITISGPLSLLDDDNQSPYDSADLAESLKKIPLLYLSDVTAQRINTDNFFPEGLNTGTHYGYQGLWSPYWEETKTTTDNSSDLTANTLHRHLYADWTAIGYVPNPEYAAYIVPATLWQTFYTLQAGLQTFDNFQTPSNYLFQTRGNALGLFVHQNPKGKIPGFRMDSIGYSLGPSTKTAHNHKVSLSFAKFHSNVKEKNSQNKSASHITFAALELKMPWFHEWIYTSTSLAYSYGSHHISSIFPTRKESAEGKTFSHSLGASASLYLPIQAVTKRFSATPFIKILGVRSFLSSFTETGSKPRKFLTDQPLCNVTVPLGVQSSWRTQFHLPCEWHFEIAYEPMVYQNTPDISTTLIVSGGTWTTEGPTIARNSFVFKGSSLTSIFPNVHIFLNYQGSVSSSTSLHYLQAGSQVTF
ncbi:polymorphic outer membrane protein middle domain-containing protein [Chlamydia pecorum]|uniref:Polymorphic outer membrane protein e family n=1 Tax=Chlamydia pecorum (strain ATCC VR-628 / DSM 29919 / E58) TaxID=331635 RepID=A0AA34RD53_CHLPE|nr:polymorphic outer membrane protein middle domain-containing protein [Chlamydia pecorum]AEB41572.1 polymorphic outer membrane protein e family [Chlamydia pecorum E58]ETF37842.1 polymorphic outer membrane protein e family [Chlamydia pecorum VR629]UFP07116.1 autotransporter domain-containing protein [Chlamydia pecorum]UJT76945.1 polymorphic outer membrane protein e family protein [Chlamydia pecorum]